MRKRWKRSFVTALSMALAVGNCVPAMAAPTGWKESAAGWQYVNADGSVQKGWFQDTKGDWYFLDYNTGVMKTGWVKPADGNWYFMDYHTGAMKTGWIKPMDGNWYYLNPVSNGTKGAMKTGWVQTPDSKWYYLNASGVMQTGTITVGDQVWTLDASGAWNGKDATTVTYVSSGNKGGTSHTTKTPAIEKDANGNVTINSANFVASALGDTIEGNLTINAKLNEGQLFELKDIVIGGKLIITENAGEGNITLDGVEVKGDTEIGGGGSNTVIFNNCKLQKVVAKKKLSDNNSVIKPLHIKFGSGTNVESVEASEGKLHLETEITIPEIITKIAILLTGSGNVTKVQIAAPININIQVKVEKVEVKPEAVDVEKGIAPEITVEKDKGTIESVEGEGADSTVITGEGEVKGYYEITLNPNGGYWVVDDIANNTTDKDDTAKVVKVKTKESIGTVLSAEGFKLPENGSKIFSGWYTAAENGTPVDMSAVGAAELFAGWADKKIGVTSAEITGATDGKAEVGTILTAVANQDATGKLSYQWSSCATEDGTYKLIEGATKSTYTVQEADAGKFIKVKISGDNGSSAESTKAVQIEKAAVVEVVKVTEATISGASGTDGKAKVGDSLAASANEGAEVTGYQWAISEDGTNYTNIEGATSTTYTVQETDAGKSIQVTITGKEDSKASATVQVEEAASGNQKTDLVITKVTATVSGAAVDAVSGDVTNNEVTLTVKAATAATGSSVTVKGISAEAKDGAGLTTQLDPLNVEVKAGETATINVTCKPVEADKYNQDTITVKVIIKVEN